MSDPWCRLDLRDPSAPGTAAVKVVGCSSFASAWRTRLLELVPVGTVRLVPVDSRCTFCDIVAGELPSFTIARTERAVAFMDINPATHGHALVIPRAHAIDLLDITADDLDACVHLAREIAGRAIERLGAGGVNVLTCSGRDAWQTVFHFHLHVIPRFKGHPDKDSMRPPWDPTPGDLEQIGRIGDQLS